MVKDGGPAFPQADYDQLRGGMSLRDYFAGQALALGGEFFHNVDNHGYSESDHVAKVAYELADAMLKARRE